MKLTVIETKLVCFVEFNSQWHEDRNMILSTVTRVNFSQHVIRKKCDQSKVQLSLPDPGSQCNTIAQHLPISVGHASPYPAHPQNNPLCPITYYY